MRDRGVTQASLPEYHQLKQTSLRKSRGGSLRVEPRNPTSSVGFLLCGIELVEIYGRSPLIPLLLHFDKYLERRQWNEQLQQLAICSRSTVWLRRQKEIDIQESWSALR